MNNISIIIPVYNAGKYLDETISSISSQMDEKDELILVNDGSTDDSAEICMKYANESTIRYYYQNNQGAPAARNKGIAEAKGDYLFFFDADDILRDGTIKFLHRVMDEGEYDVIVGNYYRFNGTSRSSMFKHINRNKTWFDYYMMDPFPGCRVYKKSIIDTFNIRFEDIRIGQDLNFNLQFLGVANKVKIIDWYFTDYRYVSGSISNSVDERILDIGDSIKLCDEFYDKNSVSQFKKQLMYTEGLKHINYQMQKIRLMSNAKLVDSLYEKFKVMESTVSERLTSTADLRVLMRRIRTKMVFTIHKHNIERHLREL